MIWAMTQPSPKAVLSWSSGKDSAFALHEAQARGLAEIAGILTTVNTTHDRVSMHGVRRSLLAAQIDALGLSCLEVPLPYPCSNDIYESRMADAIKTLKSQGITHVIFGDLFLEDIRAYRNRQLAAVDMRALYPLWKRETRTLALEMIDSGLVAYLACLDPRKVPPSLAGRKFDRDLLAELPRDVDPCGENGEFHTVVTAGPFFKSPIQVTIGETVTREGFVYTDIIPDNPSHPSTRPARSAI